MKLGTVLAFIVVMCLSSCGGTENSTNLKSDHSTANDLPNLYLSCSETVNGAEVLDGAKEVKIFKDQFGVYSVSITQKDQFSGDSTLAEFLSVHRQISGSLELFDRRVGNSGVMMNVNTSGSVRMAKLFLTTPDMPNGIDVELRCQPASVAPHPAAAHPTVLWACKGTEGSTAVSVIIQKETSSSISGIITENTPNNNGSVRSHSWIRQDVSIERCHGFSPCDSFSVEDSASNSRTLDMFVNYNNSSATSGVGHLKFINLAVVTIDADITCTRTL